jgi:hypothetical protein
MLITMPIMEQQFDAYGQMAKLATYLDYRANVLYR